MLSDRVVQIPLGARLKALGLDHYMAKSWFFKVGIVSKCWNIKPV